MPDRPEITVSIVNHGNRDLLLECLDRLERDAGCRRTREIVVLDNASSDGSAEAISARFPAVHLIAQRHRAGFGANHNTIISATRSRYVFLLNDDALVEPGVIDTLTDYMERAPRVAAAAPAIDGASGSRQQTAWRFSSPSRSVVHALGLGKVGIVQSSGTRARRVDRVSGCAVLLRRAALEEVGLFDERFFMYAEDADLCRRLADRGYEAHFVPSVTITHLSQQSTAGEPVRRLNEYWRSQHLYWRKHHSPAGARVASAMVGLAFAARAGIGWALARLPPALRSGRERNWPPAEFWLAARSAWLGVRGPGLRELAEAHNQALTSRRRVGGEEPPA